MCYLRKNVKKYPRYIDIGCSLLRAGRESSFIRRLADVNIPDIIILSERSVHQLLPSPVTSPFVSLCSLNLSLSAELGCCLRLGVQEPGRHSTCWVDIAKLARFAGREGRRTGLTIFGISANESLKADVVGWLVGDGGNLSCRNDTGDRSAAPGTDCPGDHSVAVDARLVLA